MRLFVNDIELDLPANLRLARTFQVNDIGTISDRQSNFSQKIKLPKTKKNQLAHDSLGSVGDTSRVPYQFNSAKLYNDNGELMISNGFYKVFADEGNFYDVAIYDGYISFAKAIENTTLQQLDLTDANHFKTLANVLDSFNDLTVYKYILADYNGKAIYDTNKINIDYLVPSLPVSYIWDLIFEQYGFTYEGAIFDTFEYQNLWMTYPKGVSDENPTPESYYTNTWNNLSAILNGTETALILHGSPAPTDGIFLANNIEYIVPENGTYVISSDLDIEVFINDREDGIISNNFVLEILINGAVFGVLQGGAANLGTNPFFLQLVEGDIISLQIATDEPIHSVDFNSGSITYGFLAGQNIDFNETFLDFKTKDFIDEILNRFALTPFKDKYTNNIKFLTLDEIIQNTVEDWSSEQGKFVGLTSEKFIYPRYSQLNNFIYKYNEKEGDYKDGAIVVDNINIASETDVFKSSFYAPEKELSEVLPIITNVYKLWNKEIKDDETVKYKDLDKRFYLMRYEDKTIASTTIGSESLTTEDTITQAPFESFFTLNFREIIAQYYSNMGLILNDARLIKADIFLNDADVLNLDFSKPKFIKQLSNYYLLNKVVNYQGKGGYTCELIRLKYA